MSYAETLKSGKSEASVKTAVKAIGKLKLSADQKRLATAIVTVCYERYAECKGETVGHEYPTVAMRDGLTAFAKSIGLTTYGDTNSSENETDQTVTALVDAGLISSIIPKRGANGRSIGRIVAPAGHFGSAKGNMYELLMKRFGAK